MVFVGLEPGYARTVEFLGLLQPSLQRKSLGVGERAAKWKLRKLICKDLSLILTILIY